MKQPAAPHLEAIREDAWFYRPYAVWAAAVWGWHRTETRGTPHPGPCIYVALHGAGYLVLDLVMAGYWVAWRDFFRRVGPRRPMRVVAAESQIERFLPGLPRVKAVSGLIPPDEASCLAALRAGESLLLTPGGSREAQPSRDFYRLRWEGRYGFVRLALQTGLPIVPLAVVGGAEAYPGGRWKKLSFWSPLPLPVKLRIAAGEPIAVPFLPERARDPALVRPLHALAWERTQALIDGLRREAGHRVPTRAGGAGGPGEAGAPGGAPGGGPGGAGA
ncbi:MAG: acyltransferase family protein [Anaeromyxobacter sp.]|nr:acyltransferase family protein [Anaeromyxobacter sp.]MBL0277137.1 acyltransferase family protein [Anaeromyxobacter sp.]